MRAYTLVLAALAAFPGFPAALPAMAQEVEVAAVETEAPQQPAAAAAEAEERGLPLPRYVSLKAERVNLRVGPGRDYPVTWLYLKAGLPVEIIQEYELWRRVRDAEGSEGWVYHSLLSGERTAITAPWLKGKNATISMYRAATADSTLVAQMEPGVVTKVSECSFGWCSIEAGGRHGFVAQNEVWGVYPDEKF